MGYGCWTGWLPIITSPDRINAGSVRTSGLIRLGSRLAPRIRLAGEAPPAPLPRLARKAEEFTAPEWIGFHRNALSAAPFDLAALGPLPLTLNGPGLVWLDDALMADPSILPVYALAELERHPEALIERPRALPIRRDPRPALAFHGWGVRVYGHFLIEMLPKLLLAKRFPNLFSGLLPVLDLQMPDWFRAILASQFGIGETEAIWFDSAREQLHLERGVLLPHLLRPGGFHPAARTLFADFAAITQEAPPASAERLFVARGEHENPAAPRRRLVNEAELAEIAASEFGFLRIHPEQLSFPRQIGFFAQAKIILGQTGSAMHNALFSPPGAVIGQIRFTAPDQSYIAALNGQRIAYFTQGVVESRPGIWQAEPERFRRFVEVLINCDRQSGPSEPAAGR